jgi:MOSC domain-containing protein YiiM
MQVVSTNIANPTTILWNGAEVQTGIYKNPVSEPIFLKKEGVDTDSVCDLKVHGGADKACYLFFTYHYPYWQSLYPHLEWQWGMFGENLTMSGSNESLICIGDIFRIGEALVQVAQPRQPCFKLGVRFGNQQILKQFVEYGFPGVYVRILEEGIVKAGDKMERIQHFEGSLSICEIFQLLYAIYSAELHPRIIEAIQNPYLAARCRVQLEGHLPV